MKTQPINVRLSDDTIRRLDEAAKTLGLTNRTDVIKISVNSFINYVEQKGFIRLPAEWEKILKEMDGRNTRQKKVKQNK